jgi:sulfur carrier protein
MSDHNGAIEVMLNGQPRRVPSDATLEWLLCDVGLTPQDVATALNGEFVPRGQRGQRRLQPGDSVTCFRPIVGG